MVFPHDEYVSIEEEFNSDLDLVLLVKKVIYNGTHLEVTWLEGVTESVYVDLSGWYVGHSESRYSTFEDMSMESSPEFKKIWPRVLFDKLRRAEEKEEATEFTKVQL